MLLPAGCEDVLHLLRLLIDRLIPVETGLLAERRHGLDQLIHLVLSNVCPFPAWIVSVRFDELMY